MSQAPDDGRSHLRHYYSLRSPYSWFAFERFDRELGDLQLDVELVPVYPDRENFPNDPMRFPNKIRYISMDVARLVRAYGLTFRMPPSVDTNWAKAHAACLRARQAGAERAYVLAAFRVRWCQGMDIASNEAIEVAAGQAWPGLGSERSARRGPAAGGPWQHAPSATDRRHLRRTQLCLPGAALLGPRSHGPAPRAGGGHHGLRAAPEHGRLRGDLQHISAGRTVVIAGK